mmetsp:Transcript_133430/g.266229  ORF Transcript_133430/g.266229 Transcript_133430/m.266229 type:complete len:297 (+) Transcript_133430:3154-4044(+)
MPKAVAKMPSMFPCCAVAWLPKPLIELMNISAERSEMRPACDPGGVMFMKEVAPSPVGPNNDKELRLPSAADCKTSMPPPAAIIRDFTAQVVQPFITCMNIVASHLLKLPIGNGIDKERLCGHRPAKRTAEPAVVDGGARPFLAPSSSCSIHVSSEVPCRSRISTLLKPARKLFFVDPMAVVRPHRTSTHNCFTRLGFAKLDMSSVWIVGPKNSSPTWGRFFMSLEDAERQLNTAPVHKKLSLTSLQLPLAQSASSDRLKAIAVGSGIGSGIMSLVGGGLTWQHDECPLREAPSHK